VGLYIKCKNKNANRIYSGDRLRGQTIAVLDTTDYERSLQDDDRSRNMEAEFNTYLILEAPSMYKMLKSIDTKEDLDWDEFIGSVRSILTRLEIKRRKCLSIKTRRLKGIR